MTDFGAKVRLYSRPGNDLTYRFPVDRYESQPGGEVASLREAGAIADRRHHGTRDDRADPRHGHHPLATSSCSASGSIWADTAAMRSSKRRQSWTNSAMRLTIRGDSASVFELRILGSEAADLIDHTGPLAHEARAHPMQCQQVHLFRRLDRHEVHGWPLHGFANPRIRRPP